MGSSMIWYMLVNSKIRKYVKEDICLKEHAEFVNEVNLEGKVVIVTGGSSGIGKSCVKEFAKRGAVVILACRNLEKGETAKHDIQKCINNGKIIVMKIDVSDMTSVHNFVTEFKKDYNKLHILLNNAGIYQSSQRFTKDGFESVMATNHLGHFLLTMLLLDNLKSSTPSRVVNVSSIAQYCANDLYLEDFHTKQMCFGPSKFYLYARSKAANVMFTKEFNKRYASSGVTSYCCHPGTVKTEMSRDMGNISFDIPGFVIFNFLFLLEKAGFNQELLIKSSDQGAQTPIFCCLKKNLENEGGSYFRECKNDEVCDLAKNDEKCNELWRVSEEAVFGK